MMLARRLMTLGLATFAAFASAAVPAGAHLVRPVSSFKAIGTERTYGVAVEQATGDVYVTGVGSDNIEKFSASGAPEASFVSPALEFPISVAVDNSGDASKGDVYVAEYLSAVLKLDSSGKEVAGFTPITASSIPAGDPGLEGIRPCCVAVDPSNGNVIVADQSNNEVDIFSSDGVFISQFSAQVVFGVAVGAGSKIFTSGPNGTQEWSPSEAVPYSTPTTISSEFGRAVGADLSTGDLLADEETYVSEYEASGALHLQFGEGFLEAEASHGVAVREATDAVYVGDENNDSVYVFGTPEELAEVITGTPATGITGTTASVSGTVAPEGTAVTECHFEYGLSTTYGAKGACSEPPRLPLTGNGAPVAVSADLEGLKPDETYHYRLVAVNANGSSYGEDQTFQTPQLAPSLDGQSVSAVTQTSAALDARINPNDEDTTYHFEYGATAAYGTAVPVPDVDIGAGYGDVDVGQEISGLSPGTTYHFRVVATNASSPSGGTTGADQTFTTPPLQPPVVSTGQASGVQQNAATLTGTIDAQGFETVYEFDIGTDTSYGTRIFGDAGREPGSQPYTVTLQGLAPGTTYHYRILATNAFGTTYGTDQTLTTASYPSAVLSAPLTPALVPTALLAPTGTTSIAKAASAKLTAHVGRRGGARKSGRRSRAHKSSGERAAGGNAADANRRSK